MEELIFNTALWATTGTLALFGAVRVLRGAQKKPKHYPVRIYIERKH
jgi:hypothetical protein